MHITTDAPPRERFTPKDEFDLRTYFNDSAGAVSGVEAFSYEFKPKSTGGGSYAPSDSQLRCARDYRRVEAIRELVVRDIGGEQHWGVLRIAYGLRVEPRPAISERHPRYCRSGCSCVEDNEAYVRAWRMSVEARCLRALAPYTEAARARAVEMAVGAERDRVGALTYQTELAAIRQAEDAHAERVMRVYGPREAKLARAAGLRGFAYAERVAARTREPVASPGMAAAQRVFEAMARVPVPVGQLLEYAMRALSTSRREDEAFHVQVREEATDLLGEARDAWVRARRLVSAEALARGARTRDAVDARRRERRVRDEYLADVLTSVRALVESAAAAE